jgi:hypothetical protein
MRVEFVDQAPAIVHVEFNYDSPHLKLYMQHRDIDRFGIVALSYLNLENQELKTQTNIYYI